MDKKVFGLIEVNEEGKVKLENLMWLIALLTMKRGYFIVSYFFLFDFICRG